MQSTVLILMSTYNGEKFLVEQLDSILNQEKVTVHFLIRDDGSTDSTLQILEKYKKQHNNIEIIKGDNIGWRKSFMCLVQYAEKHYSNFNYFAFADQDDIWLPEKLHRAITKLQTLSDGINMYCSNLFYYKNGINHGLIRKNHIIPTYKNCLVRNYATGCTIVFNKKTLLSVSKEIPSIIVAHDYWIYIISVLLGSVIIDNNSSILYRQHENNQIGSKGGLKDVWTRRLKNLKRTFNEHEKELLAKELLRIYGNSMPSEAKLAVKKVAYYRTSWKNKLSLMFDSGYSMNRKSNNFWLRIKILLGIL